MIQQSPDRNYNTITPSAKMLLLLKGHTTLPYARQAAELVSLPEKYEAGIPGHDIVPLVRMLHFEERYLGIDQLLADIEPKNILELSSGFSFRGLDMIHRENVYYIDTDLPDMIETKRALIAKLTDSGEVEAQGTLEVLPLNALDEEAFRSTIGRFPEGELTIVNEGLLMYLGIPEKEKLCGIIHRVLEERGGYWITADIYKKPPQEWRDRMNASADDKTQEFFAKHRIDDNMFNSFEEALDFFTRMGFVVDKEAAVSRTALSAVKYLPEAMKQQLSQAGEEWNMRKTWRLKVG